MFSLLLFLIVFLSLAYLKASVHIWTGTLGLLLLFFTLGDTWPDFIIVASWLLFIPAAIVMNVASLRRSLLSNRILAMYKKVLPPMSQTEKDALDAGTVWWDGELFSGDPNWHKLRQFTSPPLSEKERAFVDGPVNQLCEMLDDWKISQELNDLPEDVWDFIKKNRFLGMIIPEQYGGLGFSALAHSEVVMKISTRSVASAVTVMVPNSLGPAELLLRYGTEAQKNHYLPRLAVGEEVPCFALTSPEAGSDASSIPDYGIVCRQTYEGEENVLGIRVTWDKRYITLGPVATVLGLAFKLYDPDKILGDQKDVGITCALIPTTHPGVKIGRRHHPLGIAFQNGPNHGKDVFIPIDWVIGGKEQVGKGWRMLMECLAAGRSISLPALSVGGAKFSSLSMGSYSRVRKQFKTPIGYFEGIEEALTRIAGNTYMMDAARVLTAGALDSGESPSVISAILKYNLTERMRKAVNDAMDIQGGAGICLGPNNILGKLYQAIPISITVEGANILTRSLIIFGQGAIRCHPYVLKEIEAAQDDNHERASKQFDDAIWGHFNFLASNTARTFVFGLTRGMLINVPADGATHKYYQQLTRFSAAFALTSDAAMLNLGGTLKMKEKLSGRLADILGLLYMTSATIKHFEEQGQESSDLALLRWCCEENLYEIQETFNEIFDNFPNRLIAGGLRICTFPTGRYLKRPDDRLGRKVARLILSPSETRDRLTRGVFVSKKDNQPLKRLEDAFLMADYADALEKRLFRARKNGEIAGRDIMEMLNEGLTKGLIDDEEYEQYMAFELLRKEIIKVDDFAPNQFRLNQ